jgi:hypothetical protein
LNTTPKKVALKLTAEDMFKITFSTDKSTMDTWIPMDSKNILDNRISTDSSRSSIDNNTIIMAYRIIMLNNSNLGHSTISIWTNLRITIKKINFTLNKIILKIHLCSNPNIVRLTKFRTIRIILSILNIS